MARIGFVIAGIGDPGQGGSFFTGINDAGYRISVPFWPGQN
jgi:hypothetical protein